MISLFGWRSKCKEHEDILEHMKMLREVTGVERGGDEENWHVEG